MNIKLATFNAENLFLRYKLLNKEKGSRMPKPIDPDKFLEQGGHINMFGVSLDDMGPIGKAQRKNTAQVILANQPNVVALQEVENMQALKMFNQKYLKKMLYKYCLLIDGNDPRQIDVALLSKFPIVHGRSYQFETDEKKQKIFSRDCLEADIMFPGNKVLTLFMNHFKSQIGGGAERRKKQTAKVAEIIKSRFRGKLDRADFAVLGDFNAGPAAPELSSLLNLKGMENVIEKRIEDREERWTHYYPERHERNQFDYILLSESLSKKTQGLPHIERRGLSDEMTIYQGPRFPGVGPEGTEASDHCAVIMPITI